MTVKKYNKQLVNKFDGWMYWDIFDAEIQKVAKDRRLAQAQSIIENCEPAVEDRAESNDKNLDQVRRSVAGDYFQGFIASTTAETATNNDYRVLHNPTLSKNDDLKDLALTLNGNEVKPDTDLVYYKPDDDSPIMIFSCKTSLRERLAQSGMWKIVYETAEHECSDEDCPTHNYSFAGDIDREIYIGFITIDWYDEVESDDVVDLLDLGYVANPANADRSADIYPVAELADHIESDWDFL